MVQPLLSAILGLALMLLASMPLALQSKELLLLTDDAPPHMIKANNSGIDLDIVSQVLARMGYQVNVFYTPLSRAERSVKHNLADVTVPTFFQQDSTDFYLSEPIVYYRPTVFSLTGNNTNSSEFSQLRDKRIMTFQGAKGYFGANFTNTVANNDYREMHDMSVLPELLLKDRTDLVVLDYYVFYYFAKQRIENFVPSVFKSVPLMMKVPAYAGFHSKQIRDEFNLELAKYLAEGKDKIVFKKYLGDDVPLDLAAR